jgi:hypothetical protein
MMRSNRTALGWLGVLAAGSLALSGCQSNPAAGAEHAGWAHYGLTESSGGAVMEIGEVKGHEKDIIVEGEALKMCTTSGCWVVIRDEAGSEIFVMCEDEGFHLPTNTVGHRVMAHGDGTVKVTTVEQLRHYAQVSGASKEEIARITQPERTISLVADSVYILGDDLDIAMTPEEAEAACEAASGEN